MSVIIFLILCAALAVFGIVWLYQLAQGKVRRTPDPNVTDALQRLKQQGAAAASKLRKKDK